MAIPKNAITRVAVIPPAGINSVSFFFSAITVVGVATGASTTSVGCGVADGFGVRVGVGVDDGSIVGVGPSVGVGVWVGVGEGDGVGVNVGVGPSFMQHNSSDSQYGVPDSSSLFGIHSALGMHILGGKHTGGGVNVGFPFPTHVFSASDAGPFPHSFTACTSHLYVWSA